MNRLEIKISILITNNIKKISKYLLKYIENKIKNNVLIKMKI